MQPVIETKWHGTNPDRFASCKGRSKFADCRVFSTLAYCPCFGWRPPGFIATVYGLWL